MNLLETVWKRATRSGDLHSKTYEEKLSKQKLFFPVKKKTKGEGTAIFQYVKNCCRVEGIPLIFLFIGNSTGRGTGYLLREGKGTIWFSCYSVIPPELHSTLACSVFFTTDSLTRFGAGSFLLCQQSSLF